MVKERDDLLCATRYGVMMIRYARLEPRPKAERQGERRAGGWDDHGITAVGRGLRISSHSASVRLRSNSPHHSSGPTQGHFVIVCASTLTFCQVGARRRQSPSR